MIDWFDILVWRIMLPFTLAASLVYLIEVLPIRLAAVHRSWLWRAVYLKTLVAIFIPTSAMLMLPLPTWLSYGAAASTSRLDTTRKASDTVGTVDSANLTTAVRNSSSMDVSAANSRSQAFANASVGRRWRDWGWAMGGWYLFGAWLTGVWLLSLLFVYRYVQLIVLLFQESSKASMELMQMVSVTARQLGVSKPGSVILSPGVSGPLLMFAGRTTLVLPKDFEERYGTEGCRMAIAHELAHHRRGDLWWNIITAVVSIALFFWPPAWIAARRYYLAMEMACDNEAIRRARLSLVDYAELLVRLLDDRRDRGINSVSLSMAWAGTFRALSERIRFMKVDVQNFRVRQNFSMALALLVLGLMAVPITFGQEQEESKPKSTGSSKLDNSPKSLDKKEEKKSGGSTSSSSSAFSSGGGFSFGSSGGQGGTFFRSGGGSGGMAGGGVVVGGSASSSSGTPDDDVPSESPGYRSGSSGSRSSGTKSGRSFAAGGVSTSNGLTVTQNVEDVDGVSVKTTRIKDKKNDVTIVENETDGITVTIRTPVKGKDDKVKTVKADDAEQLKKESAEAYRWYKKYASGPAGSVSIQNGGANAMAGGNAGGFAGGNAGGVAGGAEGGFGFPGNGAGNPAKAMMEQQIRQMMNETNDPVMKAQLQTVLDRMKESEQPQKDDEADDSL
jgi:beta-lactamase regulating signal transducer with metallopeptidase domain